MAVRVEEIMAAPVVTVGPDETVGRVKEVMHDLQIHAVPVADPRGEPVGFVSSADLLNGAKEEALVRTVMSDEVATVPAYAEISKAARMMRNRHVHHLVVTHESRIVGILSTFDLLKVVEEHRFVPKNRPSPPGRPRSPRHRKEGRIKG